ncbi:hypothetical protein [Sporosarcina limicola]|uniref:Uncharacterized protein n=1 Tax=Sporosarcina limicola TaxID=34101 RepID=A0A927MKG7_9BACL|nr:hypothetical protein [Sporosarcina limicola]MBE1553209.1 hypothetical protein [Sporosarcina limicola]
MNFKSASIQVVDRNGTIVIQDGILIESDKVCAIYDINEGFFKFECATRLELNTVLTAHHLRMKDLEEEERLCSECGVPMQEGFYFESDAKQYCSEKCLMQVITWEDYLSMHDNGNGDAYWTDWYDC